VSFSDSQEPIARASMHLIPRLVEGELAKCVTDAPVYLYHMKPPSVDAIRREVKALRNPRLRFLEQGQLLTF